MLKDRVKRSFWGVSSTFFNSLSYTLSYRINVSLTIFILNYERVLVKHYFYNFVFFFDDFYRFLCLFIAFCKSFAHTFIVGRIHCRSKCGKDVFKVAALCSFYDVSVSKTMTALCFSCSISGVSWSVYRLTSAIQLCRVRNLSSSSENPASRKKVA